MKRSPPPTGAHPTGGEFAAALWLVAAAGLVFRVAILWYADTDSERFDFPDTRRYLLVARNIAAGLGPVESAEVRSGTDPLYPYLLSGGLRLGYGSDEALMRFGRVVNTIAATMTILLLGLAACRMVSPRAGLAAAALYALDPLVSLFNALVLTETVFSALLVAAVCAAAGVAGRRGPAMALAAGVFLGLGILTRSSALFLPLLVAAVVWTLAGGTAKRRAGATVLLLAGCSVTLAPVLCRNYTLFGRIVPIRSGSGASLLEALGPWADGGPGMEKIVYPAIPPGADEYKRDGICRRAALEWAWSNPGRALSLAWTKLRRTWAITLSAPGYEDGLVRAVCRLTVAPEFALALAGVYVLRRRGTLLALLLVPVLYFTLIHMVFVGSVRYRVPVLPLVFVPAGAAIDRMLPRRAIPGDERFR